MRFYVASRFEEWPRVRRVRDALLAAGHKCSHDWTREADEYPRDDAPRDKRRLHAQQDILGVVTADVVVVLCSASGGTGMWVELGAALQAGRPVIAAGASCRDRTIFLELAAHCVETDEEAAALALAYPWKSGGVTFVHYNDRTHVLHATADQPATYESTPAEPGSVAAAWSDLPVIPRALARLVDRLTAEGWTEQEIEHLGRVAVRGGVT